MLAILWQIRTTILREIIELIAPVIVGFTMFEMGVGLLFSDDVAIGEPGLSNESATFFEEIIDDNVLSLQI